MTAVHEQPCDTLDELRQAMVPRADHANYFAVKCPDAWLPDAKLPRTKNEKLKFEKIWKHLRQVPPEDLLRDTAHVPPNHVIVVLRKGGRKQYLCVTPRCCDRLARSYAGGPAASARDDDDDDDDDDDYDAAEEGEEQERPEWFQFRDYLMFEWQPKRRTRKRRRERRRERVSFKVLKDVKYDEAGLLQRRWRDQRAYTFAQQCDEVGKRQQAERDAWLTQLEQRASTDDSEGVPLPGTASDDGTGPCWAPVDEQGYNAVGWIVTKLREMYLTCEMHRCTEKDVIESARAI